MAGGEIARLVSELLLDFRRIGRERASVRTPTQAIPPEIGSLSPQFCDRDLIRAAL
jgi:hypothetical protein